MKTSTSPFATRTFNAPLQNGSKKWVFRINVIEAEQLIGSLGLISTFLTSKYEFSTRKSSISQPKIIQLTANLRRFLHIDPDQFGLERHVVQPVVPQMGKVVDVSSLTGNGNALVVVGAHDAVVVHALPRRQVEVDVDQVGTDHHTRAAFARFAMNGDYVFRVGAEVVMDLKKGSFMGGSMLSSGRIESKHKLELE